MVEKEGEGDEQHGVVTSEKDEKTAPAKESEGDENCVDWDRIK